MQDIEYREYVFLMRNTIIFNISTKLYFYVFSIIKYQYYYGNCKRPYHT